MSTVLFKQPAGLGDILFCQKMGKLLAAKGCRVMWPVSEVYKDILPYINGHGIEYINIIDEFEYKDIYTSCPKCHSIQHSQDCIVVCTDGCFNDDGVLKPKYELVGLDWSDWSNYLTFNRNNEKEKHLFYNVLELQDNEKFSLVNDFMCTPPETRKLNLDVNLKYRRVDVRFIDDYSLFDWLLVAEKASEIFMEGSAFTYMLEKTTLQAETLGLFSRNFKAIEGLFSHPWKQLGQINY